MVGLHRRSSCHPARMIDTRDRVPPSIRQQRSRMMVILALLVLTTPTPTTVGDTDAGRRRPDIRRAEESP
jgi:hypothetical protein